jgi:hypothetical protein
MSLSQRFPVENVPRDPIPSRIDPFTRSSPCGHPPARVFDILARRQWPRPSDPGSRRLGDGDGHDDQPRPSSQVKSRPRAL